MYELKKDDIVDIKEAPPKELLEDFGGETSVENYRKDFNTIEKDYIIFIPPIKPITTYIEERHVDSNNEDGKRYILKRSKPLAKKRSIISSMKIKMKSDDSDEE